MIDPVSHLFEIATANPTGSDARLDAAEALASLALDATQRARLLALVQEYAGALYVSQRDNVRACKLLAGWAE